MKSLLDGLIVSIVLDDLIFTRENEKVHFKYLKKYLRIIILESNGATVIEEISFQNVVKSLGHEIYALGVHRKVKGGRGVA